MELLGVYLGSQLIFVILDGGLFVLGLEHSLTKFIKDKILFCRGIVPELFQFILDNAILKIVYQSL